MTCEIFRSFSKIGSSNLYYKSLMNTCFDKYKYLLIYIRTTTNATLLLILPQISQD